MELAAKLQILADAAKYDVSCSSSGSNHKRNNTTIGTAAKAGICHSFTQDGRCISLLKILMSNACIYDCAYCINRCSNDIPRATFCVDEVCELTMNFYRRNYIEGLFLSSAVIQSPNYTMELLLNIVRKLRTHYAFGGYIHLKAIPGAAPELIRQAGYYVDRMSVNIELPSSQSLLSLAPQKNKSDILSPMHQIKHQIIENKQERKTQKRLPVFTPAGQTTQMIIGASNESDLQILNLVDALYKNYSLKRIYYSAYIPVNADKRLPILHTPPLIRENRLYQCDWLLRFYGFQAQELLDPSHPYLDLTIDPKLSWALRNEAFFPIEINTAPLEHLLRVPGIGTVGAKRIIHSRKTKKLFYDDLKNMGIQLKKSQYFITCRGFYYGSVPYDSNKIKDILNPQPTYQQLALFPELSEQAIYPALA